MKSRQPVRLASWRKAWMSGASAWVLVASALALASPGLAADREIGLARLVGVWQLDHRVSEDPHRMLRDAERGYVPQQGKKAKPQPDFEQRAILVTDGSNVLTLAYREGEISLTNWNDIVQTLHVDGKKWPAERGGFAVTVEAEWKSSDRLVVRTSGAPGGWIRETYELGERGDKLFVLVELQRPGSKTPFSFNRLYNRTGGQE